MEITKRLIGCSAIDAAKGQVADVDMEGLVRRLLLFDQYVMVSVRLQEFPHLVRYLGYEGLRDLLFSRALEIRCEWFQLAQVAQSGLAGSPKLPLLKYQFNWIDAHDRDKDIAKALDSLADIPGLRNRQIRVLKEAIIDAIKPLSQESKRQLWPDFQGEVQNPIILKAATEMALRKMAPGNSFPFELKLHRDSEEVFTAETDLATMNGVGLENAHKIAEAGLLGVAGLTQAVTEMKIYSALSGFRDEELPLFRTKLQSLADVVSSGKREASFQRVIELADLPRFYLGPRSVDVGRLLEVRESDEVTEFRAWLTTCDPDDKEIRDRVASLRAKIGLKVGSGPGKFVRYLVTTGLGVLPGAGLILGPAASALDYFLIDRIVPRTGVAAFVNELYPSIFSQREPEGP
jgi:hypothetical protein